MITVTGNRKNKTQIKRKALKVAQSLGIDQPVTIRFMDYDSPDKWGFAAEILGQQYVCIFNDCPDEKVAQVISHELIHTQQMIRGDLKFDYSNMTFYWKGDVYDEARLASIDYYSRPWEAEAKQKESQLAQLFI